MQPSVIYIDEIEKILSADKKKGGKKKGADGGGKPARIKKELLAQIEALKPGDRILIIGNSRAPWDGDETMSSAFDRIIYTVRPDYGSRLEIWKKMILSMKVKLPNDFDFSTMAYISDGYTAGSVSGLFNIFFDLKGEGGKGWWLLIPSDFIFLKRFFIIIIIITIITIVIIIIIINDKQKWQIVTVVKNTLTDRRIKHLELRPLNPVEFIAPLAKIAPVFKEENLKFKAFTDALPAHLRKRKQEDDKEVVEDEEGGGKKKGGKKKGGKKKK